MVAQKAQNETKTRGEGDAAFFFVDKAGKNDYKRVPTDVAKLRVAQKAGAKEKVYDLASIPASVKDALVAMAVAQRCKVYVANHANENGNNVIELVDKLIGEINKGQIYTRSSEGGKAGRPFDVDKYVNAVAAGIADMVAKKLNAPNGKPIQPMSAKAKADLKAKLEAAEPKDRTVMVRKFKANAFIKRRILEAEMNAVDTSSVEGLEDLF